MGFFRKARLKNRLLFGFIVIGWFPVALACLHVYRHEVDRRQNERLALMWEVHARRAAAVGRWVGAMDRFFDLVTFQSESLMGGQPVGIVQLLNWQVHSMMNAGAAWLVIGQRIQSLEGLDGLSSPQRTIPENVLSEVQTLKTRAIGQLHIPAAGAPVDIFSSVPLYGGSEHTVPFGHLILRNVARDPFREMTSGTNSSALPFHSYVKSGDQYYDLTNETVLRFPWDPKPTHAVGDRVRFDPVGPFSEGSTLRGDFWAAESDVQGTAWKLVTLFPLAGMDQDLLSLKHRLLFLAVMSGLGFVSIAVFLSLWVTVPLNALRTVTAEMVGGNVSVSYDAVKFDEFKELAHSLDTAVRSLAERLEMQRLVASIHETMVGAADLRSFAETLLLRLMDVTGAEFGAGYLLDSDAGLFRPACSVGMRGEALVPFAALTSEGEFGRALVSGQLVHLRDAPPETRYIYRAVAGDMIPREILTMPLKGDGEITVVFSLASLGSFPADRIRVLEEVRHAMDTACARFWALEHIGHMNREISRKNAQLQEQKERLEVQAVELEMQAEELREQNAALEIKQRELDEANRLKDEFLATVSHELRTPLHSILAVSRLLQSEESDQPKSRRDEYLGIIEKNGTVLLDLINDILDLSKIEADRLEVFPEPVDLTSLVRNLAENVKPLVEKKGLIWQSRVEEGIPRVCTDRGRLYQILQNLASNAIKFTERGEVSLHVRRRGEEVEFSVEDTGVGIPESALPHIFESFRQVNGTLARRHEGTGLGLAISKKLAERLGGRIWAESCLGKGSVFHVSIPLVWKGSGPIRGRAPSDEARSSRPDKVVVVDDDPEVLKTVRSWLETEGFQVETFTTLGDALEHCEKEPPSVIFTDIVLPDGDGYQVVCRRTQSEALKRVPVVIMSAARDGGTARAMGADGFVGKPLSRERVLYHVDCLLRLKTLPFNPSSKRILVVEDDEAARLQIQAVLEGAGYRTVAATTGQKALKWVAQERPDGVILDLKLPDVDGLAVLESLRLQKHTREIPVLVFTARELTKDEIGRIEANHIFQLVTKGDIRRRELVRRVDAMLRDQPLAEQFLDGGDKPRKTPFSPEQSSQELPSSVAETECQRPRVLIVEDHPDNRRLIMDYLETEFELQEAPDGQEGLRLIHEWRPDAVLLDISLPGIDGFEVARRVQADPTTCHIPVIAMTAHAMEGDQEKILKKGFTGYVAKPFRLEVLRKTLLSVLAAQTMRRREGNRP